MNSWEALGVCNFFASVPLPCCTYFTAHIFIVKISAGRGLNHWRLIWSPVLPSKRYSDGWNTEQVSQECAVFSNS